MSTNSTNPFTDIPDVHAVAIISSTSVGFCLATAVLALRFWVRAGMTRYWGYDDWILIPTYIAFMALTGLQISYGVEVLGEGVINNFNAIDLITSWHSWVYTIHQSFLKTSLGMFYLRVLQERWQRISVIVAVTIFVLYTATLGFVLLFQCGNPDNLSGDICLNTNYLVICIYVQAGLNVVADCFLTFLPITVFFQTQLSIRSKISIASVMSLGAIASAFSIARIPFLDTANVAGYESYAILSTLLILSYFENCVAQIGIAAVALRPLLRRFLGESEIEQKASGPSAEKPILKSS